jgi:hypothetical protein
VGQAMETSESQPVTKRVRMSETVRRTSPRTKRRSSS